MLQNRKFQFYVDSLHFGEAKWEDFYAKANSREALHSEARASWSINTKEQFQF